MNMKDFLKNYLGDLEYISGCGRESLNHFTSSTPYFETDEEMEEYIQQLRNLLEKDDE